MKITAQIKPNSRQESVEALPDGSFIVRANAPAIDGKANERVIELLAKHFGRPKSKVQLASGVRSKRKVFVID